MKIYVTEIKALEDAHISSRRLLADALEKVYGVSLNSLSMQKNEFGKPYFENSDIYFNISHSGSYASLAIGSSEVGIDIQKISDIPDRVMMSFVGKTADTAEEKTRLWTEYESFSKLIGVGIPFDKSLKTDCAFKSFFTPSGYVLSVCVKKEDESELSDTVPMFII